MEQLEDKYIRLLIDRCCSFSKSKSLMIHCDFKEHIKFAEKVKEYAIKKGITDVCIHVNDMDDIHTYLYITDIDEMELNPLIDRSDWDNYAKKNAAMLFLNSTVPGLMNDIDAEKIQKWVSLRSETTKYYRSNVSKYTFPWCIAALPNERWARSIFGNVENAYDKLYLKILEMCMVDTPNPIEAWNQYINKNNYYKDKLNELNIRTLHYTNSLGTDLTLKLPKNSTWCNIDKKYENVESIIVNMPSYEIFTSPDYRETNGIVYSSKPLFYNDCRIENFSITFKDGKAISCKAEYGQDILESIINENENANYLGEVALVQYDSPISNTKLVFNNTLFDENASCHLALGNGFPLSIPNGDKLSMEELLEKGINSSLTHVDFMIGTEDLNIEAETKYGKVLIFKNGNFCI